MMEELLKCLHCGGEAQTKSHIVFENRGEDYRKHWNGDKYYVQCESCGIRTPDCYTEQEAYDAWNRRAQQEQPDVVHGRWVAMTDYPGTYSQCTRCGQKARGYAPSMRYCPNCGAKMDGGEKGAAD